MLSGYLAYTDQQLAYQLATGIIGSEVSLKKQRNATAGISFKVIFSTSAGIEEAATTKVEHLLPEVLMDALYEAIPNRTLNLDSARPNLLPGGTNSFRPGTPLILQNAKLEESSTHTREDSVLTGEECDVMNIKSGSFSMRGYANLAHSPAIRRLVGEPVELLGILRYASPYRVPGAVALNLGFRLVGVWLL